MFEILKRYLMLSGAILMALTFTVSTGMAQATQGDNITNIVDDIKPYEGSTGPHSFFYGLKITIENLGETFTFNEAEKVKKQVEHAELRIAEAKAELRDNNIEGANKALEMYGEKIQAANDRVSGIRGNDMGLLEAQEKMIKHQLVLQQLLDAHPGNRGLETALDNCQGLEVRFESKTGMMLEREVSNDGQKITIRERREGEIEDQGERKIEPGVERGAAGEAGRGGGR